MIENHVTEHEHCFCSVVVDSDFERIDIPPDTRYGQGEKWPYLIKTYKRCCKCTGNKCSKSPKV